MIELSDQFHLWYNASTLTERLASLRAAAVRPNAPGTEIDADLAARRLQRWREQSPFPRDDYFAQRLALDSLAEDELEYLLGEPIEAVSERSASPPEWLTRFAAAFDDATGEAWQSSSGTLRLEQAAGFLEVIRPLIDLSCDSLRQGLGRLRERHPGLPFEVAAIENTLFANLFSQLLGILNRTLILELNVARMQGLLSGETGEERFHSFVQRLRQREHALALLREYPVLARLLVTCADNWLNFNLEFFRHLCVDWEDIKTTFSPHAAPGQLETIKMGAGDSHRQGRTVVVAQFTSGFRLVYKPRALAVDEHLQHLFSWLNERGSHPAFRTTKILDRGTHGWMEFIARADCATPAEVSRFYERQGGYLALLYALEAVDFHFENLIASGEHPVLIDLESLFHPRLDDAQPTQAVQLAWKVLGRSVLRIGLLPQKMWLGADHDGIDLSGLGTVAGQLSPFQVPYWESAGTDEMRFARKRMMMQGGQNRPQLQGGEVNLPEYEGAIVAGFTAVYRTLLQHREQLLATDGPLAAFAGDEVRVILRPTKNYATLLQEGYHPNLLRNALDRDRFFDRLWVEVERYPSLARVIAAERHDLLSGDIPVFSTNPCSHDLWSSTGERIAGIMQETGMNLVRRKLSLLSEEDLSAQLWFIRASFTSLTLGVTESQMPAYEVHVPEQRAGSTQFLSAAQAVGDRLEALALRSEEGDAAWIGLTFMNERNWMLMPLGLDLYNGLPGVALFLAYLGRVSQQPRYTELAEAALLTLQQNIAVQKGVTKVIGGFGGWGGVLYTLTHLSAVLNKPELIDQAYEIVELLPALIEQDEFYDVIAGTAGCLGSLNSLYRYAPSPRVLDVAVQCGDHLLAHAQPFSEGIGWLSQLQPTRALTGYSHGAAGIAGALSELFSLTGEERFRTGALAAIAYERSLFSAEEKNWPDLRELQTPEQEQSDDHFQTAWCHGAPGIGLARLQCLRQIDDGRMLDEVKAALEATSERGFGQNHCLCHGDLGNLELLLQASEILKDARLSDRLSRQASSTLESINRQGYLTGIPSGIESPGLLTGISGIGYGLLRLTAPDRVPSILTLAPPLK